MKPESAGTHPGRGQAATFERRPEGGDNDDRMEHPWVASFSTLGGSPLVYKRSHLLIINAQQGNRKGAAKMALEFDTFVSKKNTIPFSIFSSCSQVGTWGF